MTLRILSRDYVVTVYGPVVTWYTCDDAISVGTIMKGYCIRMKNGSELIASAEPISK